MVSKGTAGRPQARCHQTECACSPASSPLLSSPSGWCWRLPEPFLCANSIS